MKLDPVIVAAWVFAAGLGFGSWTCLLLWAIRA